MSFIEAYKQLEKLCGDVLNDERCISAYIDEMLNTRSGSRLVYDWDNDLKKLKHYRWVRNQIVHEPSCTEQNMCAPGDVEWLAEFYSRIMNQSDPLSLYFQTMKKHQSTKATSIHITEPHQPVIYSQPLKTKKTTRSGKVSLLFGTALIVMLILVLGLLCLNKIY